PFSTLFPYTTLFRSGAGAVDDNLGIFRPLIVGRDTGEILDLAGPRLFIKPLDVARLADFERGVDKNLEKLILLHERARHLPLALEGRDEGDEGDQPGIDHQPRRFTDAADILDPVRIGEAKILVEAVADVIAVEQIGMLAERMQLLLDEVGNRRLAGAREPREPEDGRLLPLQL